MSSENMSLYFTYGALIVLALLQVIVVASVV